MFKTIVQFTTPLSTLNEVIIQELDYLSAKYDQHSNLLSTRPSLTNSGNSSDTVERSWQDETLVNEYIEALAPYSAHLTVTKTVE